MSHSPPKTRRATLDVRSIDINDEYQFRVYRGVIRCARAHAHWELLYNARALRLPILKIGGSLSAQSIAKWEARSWRGSPPYG